MLRAFLSGHTGAATAGPWAELPLAEQGTAHPQPHPLSPQCQFASITVVSCRFQTSLEGSAPDMGTLQQAKVGPRETSLSSAGSLSTPSLKKP